MSGSIEHRAGAAPMRRAAAAGWVAAVLLASSASAQALGPPRPLRAPPGNLQPSVTVRKVPSPVSRPVEAAGQYVPNVVGVNLYDAEQALRAAGFEPRHKFLDQPDPSFGPGQVSRQHPPAGAPQKGGIVGIDVPQAAKLTGFGTLSQDDAERRIGFDLDTGRQEQITRGADLVVRYHKATRLIDENGHAYYVGEGNYAEVSDGAFFVPIDGSDVSDGEAAYTSFVQCRFALQPGQSAKARTSQVFIGVGGHSVSFCVQTSDYQMAVVSFLDRDNNFAQKTYYEFHYALFPRELMATPVRPSELKAVRR
jgi:hypothetical protein